MSSGSPPSVGAQPICPAHSLNRGPHVLPASSASASITSDPEPPPGYTAPRAPLSGSLGAASTPQHRPDLPSSSNNVGTLPRLVAVPAQAPPPATVPGSSHGTSTSKPRQAPSLDSPPGRAVPQLLTGNGICESRASA
ncbi:hypothetical protein NDU88_002751 [Pleurodeles waltl]|uniref:Uncharacterized protein n=1 Tax=Pleurodeles waltl TaxID=8319 RepID=A0AAV7VC79_PLEWA|nr:hypothetical protein NDU88_002751 [Pleurodeles waltl]